MPPHMGRCPGDGRLACWSRGGVMKPAGKVSMGADYCVQCLLKRDLFSETSGSSANYRRAVVYAPKTTSSSTFAPVSRAALVAIIPIDELTSCFAPLWQFKTGLLWSKAIARRLARLHVRQNAESLRRQLARRSFPRTHLPNSGIDLVKASSSTGPDGCDR